MRLSLKKGPWIKGSAEPYVLGLRQHMHACTFACTKTTLPICRHTDSSGKILHVLGQHKRSFACMRTAQALICMYENSTSAHLHVYEMVHVTNFLRQYTPPTKRLTMEVDTNIETNIFVSSVHKCVCVQESNLLCVLCSSSTSLYAVTIVLLMVLSNHSGLSVP